jgi:hypothetical protein
MTEWYIQRCETLVYFGWRYQSEFTTFCSLKGIFVWGTGSQSFRVFTVLFYVWFFVGEGFELGALCSLGSLSSTWATSLALFALIILEIGSGWPGLWFSYFKLPTIARMTGMSHDTQLFSVEMGFCKLFSLGWPGTVILLISASCVTWNDRRTPWLRWGLSNTHFPQPWTVILGISASK